MPEETIVLLTINNMSDLNIGYKTCCYQVDVPVTGTFRALTVWRPLRKRLAFSWSVSGLLILLALLCLHG